VDSLHADGIAYPLAVDILTSAVRRNRSRGAGCIPALLALRGGAFSKYVIPVHGLLEPLIRADFAESWNASIGLLLLAWIEVAVFLPGAAWIFRDGSFCSCRVRMRNAGK